MVPKTDTSLCIFISELRNCDKETFNRKIMIEKRKLYAGKDISYVKILTLIYFVIHDIEIDPLLFVNACASRDINIKRAGYLGLTLCKNDNLLILTVNTIMNDLKNPSNREVALNFLCNINVKHKIYNDLTDFICISNTANKNIAKGVIAKNRLSNLDNISIVGNDDTLAYVKLQIIYDKLMNNECINIKDNDIFFLVSIYNTVKNKYFKVKLVQMYRKLFEMKRLVVKEVFFNDLQEDIIGASETVKPTVCIGLSAEICELFVVMGNITGKVEHFICRLIDSKNQNSRFIGFRLAKKYNLFPEKLIDRSIKLGLNVKYAFDTLMSLINMTNYKEIYRRKEEMRYVMDKNLIDYEKSQNLIFEVILKILNFSDESFMAKVYLVNPELAFKKDISKSISESTRLDLFTKLISNPNLFSLYLLYSLFPRNIADKEFLEELFVTHVELIISKRYSKKVLLMEKLIFTICKYKNLDFFRNTLKDKYIELVNSSVAPELIPTIFNGIFLMNSKSNEKLLHISKDKFVFYTINNKTLNLKTEIKILEIEDDKSRKLHFQYDKENQEVICPTEGSLKIKIKFLLSGETYLRTIYLSN